MMKVFAASIVLVASWLPAWTLELHDHTKLGAGEFYSTWKRPNVPGANRQHSCCNERDCYQAQVRGVPGHWEYKSRVTGRWRILPEGLLEHNQPDPRESPDGFTHVCEPFPHGQPVCAVLGNGL